MTSVEPERTRIINLVVRVLSVLPREREKENPGNEVAQKFHTDDATLPQPYPASGSADWLKIYYRIGEGYKKRETVVIIIASEYSRLSSLSVAVHGRFITRSDER